MQTTDRSYIYKAQKELPVKKLKLQDFYVRRCFDLLRLRKYGCSLTLIIFISTYVPKYYKVK